MNTEKIEIRYSELALDDSCCLSCGHAINYSKARPGEICVDLGSGQGSDVLRLAEEVGARGFVYGIDISDGMLRKARKRAAKLGIRNLKFLKTELEHTGLESEHVDLLISNCTINHAADKLAVWKEIYRILKRGGRFVVSDIYAIEEVPEKYRNDPQAVAECWAGATTREVYMQTLKDAGFTELEVLEESAPYPKGEVEVASFTIAGKRKCCG